MSSIYLAAQDVTEYVMGRPRIKVISSVVNGSMYMPETSLQMLYKKGWFDTSTPIFVVGSEVKIYDDDSQLIFWGTLKSAATSMGQTDLTCISGLGAFLSGNIVCQAGPAHPAQILGDLLTNSGINHTGVVSQAAVYPGMVSLVGVAAADNTKGCDILSSLTDMMTLDLVVEAGTVVGMPYRTRTETGVIGTIESMMYPQLVDDGTGRWCRGVNMDYTFANGVTLSIGNQNENCWSAGYGNNSPVQCYGYDSAIVCANARLQRYSTPKPIIQIKIRRANFLVALGSWYYLKGGALAGYYRLVGYEYDGECYYPMLEAE